MKISRTILFIALAGLLGLAGGYFYGKQAGHAAESGKRDAQAVQGLTDLINEHKGLISQSHAASRAMRSAMSARQTRDELTTKEFRDALAATAASRDGCVFDDGVMRQLAAARDRAAQAAAFGIRGAVPAASSAPGQ